MLALRYGDISTWNIAMEKVASNVKRIVVEPNQVPEVLTTLFLSGCQWPYFLGRAQDMAAILSDVEMDWSSVEAKCDALTADTKRNVW